MIRLKNRPVPPVGLSGQQVVNSGVKNRIIRLKNIFILLLAACLLLPGCSKDEDDEISLSPSQVTFSAAGGKQIVQFRTGSAWSVSVQPAGGASWLNLGATNGQAGSQSVELSAGVNNTDAARSVVLTFRTANKSRTMRVTQQKSEYALEVSPQTLRFKGGAETKQVSVQTSATRFSAVSAADWCTVETAGPALFVRTAENRSGAVRETDITVTAGILTRVISVVQEELSPYYEDKEVVQLQAATVGTGVNLVLMGDGFVKEQLKRGGRYETAMRQAMDYFFDIEPFRANRSYFNVYMVAAESAASGISDADRTVDTRFRARLKGNGETAITWNEETCRQFVQLTPGSATLGKMTAILVLNTNQYAGTTLMSTTGFSMAACPMADRPEPYDFRGVIHHEAGGHAFGRLDDEYIYYDRQIPEDVKNEVILYQRYGMYLNVDFTDNPGAIRWRDFIGHTKYPQVGAFEGAEMYRYGIWRAEYNSCMNDNIPYFNAPSRWLIVKRIMELAGQPYSFAGFVSSDYVQPPRYEKGRSASPAFVPLARPRVVVE